MNGIVIVDAPEVIEMADNPAKAAAEKKGSSMVVALKLLSDGQADAMVSAGNTGALLVGGTMYVKRIRGIRRAALAPIVPTAGGGAVLIDSGANVECTPEYLLQFACMGSYYAKNQLDVSNPRVGLVNNGTEAGKGNALTKEAYRLLFPRGRGGKAQLRRQYRGGATSCSAWPTSSSATASRGT